MVGLNIIGSMQLLQKYGIPTVKQEHVQNETQLESACNAIGFPVAIKIVSPKISHKTEVGGIKLNIHSLEEAQKAFAELQEIQGFDSVLVQKQLKGREVIVGGKMDEQFGPTILFGLGGIFVEVFEDVSIRLCPITPKDADKMVQEIKGYSILKGARGEKPINFKALKSILLKTSKIMMKERVRELDINPLIANEKEVIAVDARVVL